MRTANKRMKPLGRRESSENRTRYLRRDTKENIEYWLMMIIPILLTIILRYMTSYTHVTAFQDWIPGAPYFGERVRWVGLKWFKIVVKDPFIWRGVKNSMRMWLIGRVFSFAPVIFAVVTAELRSAKFSGFTRVLCYLPTFMSEVVVAAIFVGLLGANGILTQLAQMMGSDCTSLLTSKTAFPWTYCAINTWQGFAWGSLLYQATIAGVDTGLYDAAKVDGCSNVQRVLHVTWPALVPVFCFNMIMGCSSLLSSDVTQIIRMYNPAVYEVADTIGSYLFRTGMELGRYSFGSAASVLQMAMSFILLWTCNKLCQKYAAYSLW